MRARALVAVIVVLACGGIAPAQSTTDSRGTTVRIDHGTGPPKGKASMALTLMAAPDVKVGKIELTLTYPTNLLTFSNAETANLGEGVDAKLETNATPDADSRTRLTVSVSTIDGKGKRQPLPSGKLAYLIFQVSEHADMGSSISVDGDGQGLTTDDPPKPIAALKVQPGVVDVEEPPASSCFFYMH